MTPIVPRIALFCIEPCRKVIKTSHSYDWFAKDFELHFFNTDVDVNILYNNKFSLIVFCGPKLIFKKAQKVNIPKIFLDSSRDIDGDIIYNEYVSNALKDINPKISIFTPAHNTFEKFYRTYESVMNQSFDNWEWIILDDSPDNKNYEFINEIIGNNSRIKLYKSNRKDSFVGSTKRQAASLCNGEYLLELDHDDELHHLALDLIIDAFKKFPESSFCYSNSCETYETGGNVNYGNNFAMGYGKHYPFLYKGKNLLGADTPINASTIRHIVGVPNHLRCWKKDFYFQIHRHNNKLAVVDDYELLIRTFLNTKMIHIPEVLYIQYMNTGGNNTQEPRRAEIQRLVDSIQKIYDFQIHNRIKELKGTDWLWNEESNTSNIYGAKPKERTTLAYVY